MADARILIVDDHPLFREALRNALGTAKSHLDISEAGSLDSLIAHLAKDDACDLVLLDLRMPGVQGLSGLIYLRSQYPNIPVVIVSASEEAGIVQKSLDLGASGFIPKSSGTATIIEAVETVLAGGVWTPPWAQREAARRSRNSRHRAARGLAHGAANPRPDDAEGRPSQQADRPCAQCFRGNGESPCLGHPAEARRCQPHPGGDCREQA